MSLVNPITQLEIVYCKFLTIDVSDENPKSSNKTSVHGTSSENGAKDDYLTLPNSQGKGNLGNRFSPTNVYLG